jgi:hypothetical protein
VRIAFVLTFRVVLAVDGGPFLGDHAGRHPQPEAEEMRGNRMQVQRAMGRVAVQVDGDAGDGDVGHHQGGDDGLPPSGLRKAMGQKLNQPVPQEGQDPVIGRKH